MPKPRSWVAWLTFAMLVWSCSQGPRSGSKPLDKPAEHAPVPDVTQLFPEETGATYSTDFSLDYRNAGRVYVDTTGIRFLQDTVLADQAILKGGSKRWALAPNQRSGQGLPLLTLVHYPDMKSRLRIFGTPYDSVAADDGRLEALLGYLFRLKHAKVTRAVAGGAETMELYVPIHEPMRHWGLTRRRQGYLFFVLFESKDPLMADELGVIPDLELLAPSAVNASARTHDSHRLFLSALRNTQGLLDVQDSSYQKALTHFQAAFELDPSYAPYLVNCAAMYQMTKNYAAGIQFLLAHPGLVASSSDLMGALGALYEEANNYTQSLEWSQKALDRDPGNVEWLINVSDALWQLGERVRSKYVILGPFQRDPSYRLGVYLASTHLGLEEYESARAILERITRDTVAGPKAIEYQLRALVGLKEYDAALRHFEEQPDSLVRDADSRYLKAFSEFHLKLYRNARLSVQSALKVDPKHSEAQQLATRIDAIIGNRTNLILRNPIAPLASASLLQEAKETLEAHADLDLESHPMVLATHREHFHYPPKGTWKRTLRQVYLVPDGNRLVRFSELTYVVNPGYARFFVNSFRIYDKNFKLLDAPGIEEFYVTKIHNTTLHPENLMVHLPVTKHPGTLFIEVVTTQQARSPGSKFPYIREVNHFPYPMLNYRFSLVSPPEDLVVYTFGDARVDSSADKLHISLGPQVQLPIENFAPSVDEFGSGFSLAPLMTWESVGEEYLEMLAEAGRSPDSLAFAAREKASELVTPFTKDPVGTLFRFARDSIRYNNYEFGLHALIPEEPREVLKKGFTDCKGHSYLLLQMLRAKGIEANPALVSLNHIGYVNQPSLHQFNHMIVHVPAGQGRPEMFLDPTEKYQPYRTVPLNLEGKNTLIVEPEKSRMVGIPELDLPDEHIVRVFHHISFLEDQNSRGRDSVVLSGKIASEFRERLTQWNQQTKNQTLISWLADGYSAFFDERFRILNESNPDEPLVFVFEYSRKAPFEAHSLKLSHYPRLELSFLRYPEARPAQAPVYFPHRVGIRSQWTYEVPFPFRWQEVELDRYVAENNLKWEVAVVRSSPQKIELSQTWEIAPFIASPEEYLVIQRTWDDILARAGLSLEVVTR